MESGIIWSFWFEANGQLESFVRINEWREIFQGCSHFLPFCDRCQLMLLNRALVLFSYRIMLWCYDALFISNLAMSLHSMKSSLKGFFKISASFQTFTLKCIDFISQVGSESQEMLRGTMRCIKNLIRWFWRPQDHIFGSNKMWRTHWKWEHIVGTIMVAQTPVASRRIYMTDLLRRHLIFFIFWNIYRELFKVIIPLTAAIDWSEYLKVQWVDKIIAIVSI